MAEQIFHIGIKALVVNDMGEILMLKEVFSDGEMQWDVPGGRMEPGETFQETLTRELCEEIGVGGYVTAEHFATVLSNKQITTATGSVALVLVVYKVTLLDGATPKPLERGVGLSWVAAQKAAELLRDKYPAEFSEKIAAL